MTISKPDITIVMSPREQFRYTQRAIESLYADQRVPFDFICIDGGSPRPVRDYLRREAVRRGFKLIRAPHYLSTNEARNLAFDDIKTRYVVFIDNDVVVAPGCLERLARCAEETGAAVVSPVICIGEPLHTRIHFGGGIASIVMKDGKKHFHEAHHFVDRTVSEARAEMTRQPTELAEFHCMLVRTEWLGRIGRFDEKLKALSEHKDFSHRICQSGGSLVIEPDAVVTQIFGRPIAWSDLKFFFCRWSEDWTFNTERHFHRKWGTAFDDSTLRTFARPRRRYALPRLRRTIQFFFGWRVSEWAMNHVANLFARLGERGRAASSDSAAQGEWTLRKAQ